MAACEAITPLYGLIHPHTLGAAGIPAHARPALSAPQIIRRVWARVGKGEGGGDVGHVEISQLKVFGSDSISVLVGIRLSERLQCIDEIKLFYCGNCGKLWTSKTIN